ncbi:DUF4190 domain-containing protein [Sinomonas notoginsengisoli]|uniref:DUF4190 domain-containing protein n=1 Tax=Sinomonas notoginsengisoli TaxID=1457311 RepID=UPI001F24BF2C|nr:DUF4190 domain-containing protein [Sinomonas notoginsengisoli]
MALSQIRRTGEGGRGLALSAVIVGWVFTGLALVLAVVYFVALSTVRYSGF